MQPGDGDSSPFATARRELWEEAGVWIGWRPTGTYSWVTPEGGLLPTAPTLQQNAWLCVDLAAEDTRDVNRAPPRWMTVEEFAAYSWRTDHLELLRTVQFLQLPADQLHPVVLAYWGSTSDASLRAAPRQRGRH